jgi:hypothetical protein
MWWPEWWRNIKDLKEFNEEFILFVNVGVCGIILKDQSKKLRAEFANERTLGFYSFKIEGRGRSITYIKEDNKIYFATNTNVYSKKWNTGNRRRLLYKGQEIHANYLDHSNDKLIIGTEKNGILFYEDEQFRSKISTTDGLNSNTILKLRVFENLLVIRSMKGIQIYNLESHAFVNLGEAEGIIPSKVIDFAISKDQLWLLEKYGYYSISFDQLSSENNQIDIGQVYLESMLVNDRYVSLHSQSEFNYDQNNIQFFFDYRDIETKNESTFLYKLAGAQEEWKTLENSVNTLEFPSLAPGSYSFLIKVKYRGKETKTIKYDFVIHPPFWQTLWFFALCTLFITSIVSLFFIRRVRKNKKERIIEFEKQKMQTDIFESKLKAIRSQMNPHFIFNSLNSIQALVLKQDSKKSYDHIEMFSDLVRQTLNFSEKNYISIHEEISFLDIYLKLETLRMKKEFTYSIEFNSDEDISIPSLLIQPFLENAIHHGLLHKEGKKTLNISFRLTEHSASCIITDNGIGRKRSAEINSRQQYRHESFSLNATQERLKILSEQNNQVFQYSILDLHDANGLALGTKVEVFFPFRRKY